jgi:RimJ/RimL family protein N-acetyltransferase
METTTTSPEKVLASWEYQDAFSILSPCNLLAFPEDFLVGLYFKTRDQGLLDLVLPGMEDHSLGAFIKLLYGKPLLVGLDKTNNNVAAYAWIWGVEGQDGAKKASLGFLFFREYHGKPITKSLARLALRWWFVKDNVDVMYGTILSSNHVARNYAKRLGFKELADLPRFFIREGRFQDATLIVMLKEDFLAREVQRCAG